MIGSSGVTGEDAGAAAGLFLTTAQASIALGVAAIGDVFFDRLGATPTAATHLDALSTALSCNLALLIATLALLLLLPRLGRKAPSMAPELVAPVGAPAPGKVTHER